MMTSRRISGIYRRIGALMLCALLAAVIAMAPRDVLATETAEQPAEQTETVSPADAGPVSQSDTSAEEFDKLNSSFKRVRAVPINVEIPYFYEEVANFSGMYIFTLPDGTMYKRVYGTLDGVEGWYEPQGADNLIPPGLPLIDTDADVVMYEKAMEDLEIPGAERQDYIGILPPEQGTTQVNILFGKPAKLLYILSASVAALLCLIILAASRFSPPKNHGKFN